MLPLAISLPGPDEARQAARQELAKPAYEKAKPPLTYRVITWVLNKLSELLDKATASVPGGRVGLLLIALLVLALLAVVVVRLRPALRSQRSEQLFDAGRVLTADSHRRRAEQAAARGDYAEAVRERLRAVVRELEQRGLLDMRPGRTADEVAREAGTAVPTLAEPLRRGATVFDEVWYGGRTADASSYAVLVELDRQVTATRLVVA
ncbi:MAG: hypothetical protein JWM02_2173 [Frankiales bacterium]|nr:hypothetical protein [Frankiales bacterium]